MLPSTMYDKLKTWSIPKRYVVVIMVFTGYANIFYLHTNLAMAVVQMTSPKNVTDQDGNVEFVSFY